MFLAYYKLTRKLFELVSQIIFCQFSCYADRWIRWVEQDIILVFSNSTLYKLDMS